MAADNKYYGKALLHNNIYYSQALFLFFPYVGTAFVKYLQNDIKTNAKVTFIIIVPYFTAKYNSKIKKNCSQTEKNPLNAAANKGFCNNSETFYRYDLTASTRADTCCLLLNTDGENLTVPCIMVPSVL